MAATIRFVCGSEVTLLDDGKTWICEDDQVREILEETAEHVVEFGPTFYSPNPVEQLAEAVASYLGAELVHVDPIPPGNNPPDTIF